MRQARLRIDHRRRGDIQFSRSFFLIHDFWRRQILGVAILPFRRRARNPCAESVLAAPGRRAHSAIFGNGVSIFGGVGGASGWINVCRGWFTRTGSRKNGLARMKGVGATSAAEVSPDRLCGLGFGALPGNEIGGKSCGLVQVSSIRGSSRSEAVCFRENARWEGRASPTRATCQRTEPPKALPGTLFSIHSTRKSESAGKLGGTWRLRAIEDNLAGSNEIRSRASPSRRRGPAEAAASATAVRRTLRATGSGSRSRCITGCIKVPTLYPSEVRCAEARLRLPGERNSKMRRPARGRGFVPDDQISRKSGFEIVLDDDHAAGRDEMRASRIIQHARVILGFFVGRVDEDKIRDGRGGWQFFRGRRLRRPESIPHFEFRGIRDSGE